MSFSALAAFALALAATAQDPAPAPPAPAPRVETSKPADPELAPFERLADELQSALEEGTIEDLNACFDLDRLLEKGTQGVDADENFRKGFTSGVRQSLLPTLLKGVQDPLRKGGSLRLLRIRQRGESHCLLLRLIMPNPGFEYLEFAALVGEDGKARVSDWFPYSSGEWISETLHRLYLPFALDSQRGLLDRLVGKDQLMVKHWKTVKKLTECVQQGKREEGLKICGELPEELQKDKFVLLKRLHLAQMETGSTDYLHVLEDLRRFHPDDPASHIHSIDYFYARKEWQHAVQSVRLLEQRLGGDPYLDWLESTLLMRCADLPAARKAVERSLEGEPDRKQTHWTLVTICLQQQDHSAVLAALERMDQLFTIHWKDFTHLDAYKVFAASPQHEEWKTYLASKK